MQQPKSVEQFLSDPTSGTHYLVRPLLPAASLMLLVGEGGSYKSYIAMNIAYQMAAGLKVLGHWEVVRPLKVLYIEHEIGPQESKLRLQKIHKRFNSELALKNFFLSSKDLEVQLDTNKGHESLMNKINTVNPDVLILDPLVEFHTKNENNPIEMKVLLYPLRKELHKRNCGLIIVHHPTKPSEYRPGTTLASVRGAYLGGAANTVIISELPVKTDLTIVRLHFPKIRGARALQPMTFKFEEELGGLK